MSDVVTVHCSSALLQSQDPLPGNRLPELLQSRGIELKQIKEYLVLPENIPWAYLESSFDYATHSKLSLVTRFPVIFFLVGPEDFHNEHSPLMKSHELARQLVGA